MKQVTTQPLNSFPATFQTLEVIEPTMLKELERLFQLSWSDFRFDVERQEGIPNPIAVLKDGKLIGGLAFTLFSSPEHSGSDKNLPNVIWINALYVDETWRGQGVARHLIDCAMQLVSTTEQKALFAYTDVPLMYLHLGWKTIDSECEENHQVVGVELT
ncbi:GNAT family N-acetyltransferase [Vibrio mediterranei]|nr:GNAT family N-acetyltransferase [Vibrio mediterranei]